MIFRQTNKYVVQTHKFALLFLLVGGLLHSCRLLPAPWASWVPMSREGSETEGWRKPVFAKKSLKNVEKVKNKRGVKVGVR